MTFDPVLENVWVACYGGSILLFNEKAQLKNDQSNYAVIIGSFLSASKAHVYMEKMKQQGYTSELIMSDGGRYRVCVEKFAMLNEAEQSLPKYQELNKGAWILKMK